MEGTEVDDEEGRPLAFDVALQENSGRLALGDTDAWPSQPDLQRTLAHSITPYQFKEEDSSISEDQELRALSVPSCDSPFEGAKWSSRSSTYTGDWEVDTTSAISASGMITDQSLEVVLAEAFSGSVESEAGADGQQQVRHQRRGPVAEDPSEEEASPTWVPAPRSEAVSPATSWVSRQMEARDVWRESDDEEELLRDVSGTLLDSCAARAATADREDRRLGEPVHRKDSGSESKGRPSTVESPVPDSIVALTTRPPSSPGTFSRFGDFQHAAAKSTQDSWWPAEAQQRVESPSLDLHAGVRDATPTPEPVVPLSTRLRPDLDWVAYYRDHCLPGPAFADHLAACSGHGRFELSPQPPHLGQQRLTTATGIAFGVAATQGRAPAEQLAVSARASIAGQQPPSQPTSAAQGLGMDGVTPTKPPTAVGPQPLPGHEAAQAAGFATYYREHCLRLPSRLAAHHVAYIRRPLPEQALPAELTAVAPPPTSAFAAYYAAHCLPQPGWQAVLESSQAAVAAERVAHQRAEARAAAAAAAYTKRVLHRSWQRVHAPMQTYALRVLGKSNLRTEGRNCKMEALAVAEAEAAAVRAHCTGLVGRASELASERRLRFHEVAATKQYAQALICRLWAKQSWMPRSYAGRVLDRCQAHAEYRQIRAYSSAVAAYCACVVERASAVARQRLLQQLEGVAATSYVHRLVHQSWVRITVLPHVYTLRLLARCSAHVARRAIRRLKPTPAGSSRSLKVPFRSREERRPQRPAAPVPRTRGRRPLPATCQREVGEDTGGITSWWNSGSLFATSDGLAGFGEGTDRSTERSACSAGEERSSRGRRPTSGRANVIYFLSAEEERLAREVMMSSGDTASTHSASLYSASLPGSATMARTQRHRRRPPAGYSLEEHKSKEEARAAAQFGYAPESDLLLFNLQGDEDPLPLPPQRPAGTGPDRRRPQPHKQVLVDSGAAAGGSSSAPATLSEEAWQPLRGEQGTSDAPRSEATRDDRHGGRGPGTAQADMQRRTGRPNKGRYVFTFPVSDQKLAPNLLSEHEQLVAGEVNHRQTATPRSRLTGGALASLVPPTRRRMQSGWSMEWVEQNSIPTKYRFRNLSAAVSGDDGAAADGDVILADHEGGDAGGEAASESNTLAGDSSGGLVASGTEHRSTTSLHEVSVLPRQSPRSVAARPWGAPVPPPQSHKVHLPPVQGLCPIPTGSVLNSRRRPASSLAEGC